MVVKVAHLRRLFTKNDFRFTDHKSAAKTIEVREEDEEYHYKGRGRGRETGEERKQEKENRRGERRRESVGRATCSWIWFICNQCNDRSSLVVRQSFVMESTNNCLYEPRPTFLLDCVHRVRYHKVSRVLSMCTTVQLYMLRLESVWSNRLRPTVSPLSGLALILTIVLLAIALNLNITLLKVLWKHDNAYLLHL